MAQLNKKIQAFTLLEAMVSIAIVAIVFGLSTTVIVTVSSSGITKEKQNAHMLVENLRNTTLRENRFLDETIELENGIFIEKTILDYSKGDNLKILLIEAYQQDLKLKKDGKIEGTEPKIIVEHKELIILNLEE